MFGSVEYAVKDGVRLSVYVEYRPPICLLSGRRFQITDRQVLLSEMRDRLLTSYVPWSIIAKLSTLIKETISGYL